MPTTDLHVDLETSMTSARPSSDGPMRLLPRVRALFRRLAWLTLLVELIEWVDATSPLFPQRAVAAVALVAAFGWTLLLRARSSSPWWSDVGIAAIIAITGWGMGRPGAVLTLLLGATLLRVLYGSRRSAILGTGALIAGYATAAGVHDGVGGVLDLGMVTVAVALSSFAAVIRYLGEVLARHDVTSVWDDQLTRAAGEMVAARTAYEVDAIVARAVVEVSRTGPVAAQGLIPVPDALDLFTGSDASGADEIEQALGDELAGRLVRLRRDEQMIRDRIESDARYRDLAERNRDGIYLRELGSDDRLLYMNPAAAALMPESSADADGPIEVGFELVHDEDHAVIQEQIDAVGYLAEPVQFRLGPDPDGEERWVEVEELVTTGAGGVPLVQGTIRDISHQRRHAAALEAALDGEREMTEQLRKVDELRATFLAAVSHELRTPLAALLGSSQTLAQHRDRLTEDQSQLLADAVARQGARLQSLLDDLLDVERLSQGLIVPEREPTRLLELVNAVVDEHREKYPAILIEPDSDDVVLDVDASQVERIVDNLVRNARKHTPEGTTIAVSVRGIDGGAHLIVEDDGPGIPAALRGSLFEPFAQGPSVASSPSPGTGIGLSLVRQFAELHGGRAWIEESAAGGARFTVELLGAGACENADGERGASATAAARRDGLVGSTGGA